MTIISKQLSYIFDELPYIVTQIIEKKKRLIYLAGASASGKSHIWEELVKQLNQSGKKVLLISSDSYYSNDSSLKYLLYGTFDHPNLIDYGLLQYDIEQYFITGKIDIPSYSFIEKRRTNLTTYHEQYDVIIVEGLYTIDQLPETIIWINKEIIHAYKIFVDSPQEEIIFRRLLRDQARTKEPLHMIIGVMSSVFPMWTLFGQIQYEKANCIITNEYQILNKEWLSSKRERISMSEIPTAEKEKIYYMTDYIYNDSSDGNGKIIISEVYTTPHGLLNHVIIHKRDSDPRINNTSYESISMTLYQPAISTELHMLLQLAQLNYEWSYKKIVSYYKDTITWWQTIIKEKSWIFYRMIDTSQSW